VCLEYLQTAIRHSNLNARGLHTSDYTNKLRPLANTTPEKLLRPISAPRVVRVRIIDHAVA